MKSLLAISFCLVACSVPEKHEASPDASPDARPSPDGAVDDMAPDTIITSAPGEFDSSRKAIFEFWSDDATATFVCTIDGDSPVPCQSPYTRSLADGPHTFVVRAVDLAGNPDDTPAMHAWTIDTIAPSTSFTATPPSYDNSSIVDIGFTSNEMDVSFDCSLDGHAYEPCHSGGHVGPLGDGPHSFAVRARDRAGNYDSSPAVVTWVLDTSTPDTMITNGPTGVIQNRSAGFTFLSPDAGSGATFQCRLDGGTFSPCASPANYVNLADGPHTFAVRVIDSANNADPTPATRMWTIDNEDPTVTITTGPSGTTGPRTNVAFTVSDGTIACALDNVTLASCTSPLAFNVSAGAHTFRVQATDGAGNIGTATRAWTTACAAPDPAGAVGLLHFDTGAQIQVNSVAGKGNATLGATEMDEPSDPKFVATARYDGGIQFDNNQFIAWPLAGGTSATPTVELWAKSDRPMATVTLVSSADGRLVLRLVPATGHTMRYSWIIDGMVVSSAAVEEKVWHHVVATVAGGALRLYVDGARFDLAMGAPATAIPFDSLQIGGTYKGILDEPWLSGAGFPSDDTALARYCPL